LHDWTVRMCHQMPRRDYAEVKSPHPFSASGKRVSGQNCSPSSAPNKA
jgi:hypothetical protein